MLLKYRVISGTIWNAVNSSATFFISIGTIAVLARLLTPEDFGLFAMITVAMTILDSFSDMGVSAAVISYRDVTDKELNSLFYFNILVGGLLTLLLILVSPLVVLYYQEPKIYLYLWILSANFVITSPAVLFNVLLKKEMRFKILSKINILSSVVYAVTAIGYAFFTRDIMSFVVGMLAQSLISTCLIIISGLNIWKPGKLSIKFKDIRRFISFGLFQMGERIINRINWNIDYLIIGRYLGTEALGFYSIAYNLMLKPIQKINPIITTVAFPALSEIQNDMARLRFYFLKMIRYIIYIMAPIYLLFFSLSEGIILFLYGSQWYPSVPVLSIFAFLGILYAVGNPMGNLILAKGRADIGFWWNVGQTLFLFIANMIGVRWGVTGVAISTLSVTLFLFFPAGFFIRKYLADMGVKEYLAQLAKPILFASLAAGAILSLQRFVPLLHDLLIIQQLIIYGCVFLMIYISLAMVLDKPEVAYVRQTLKDYFSRKQESKDE